MWVPASVPWTVIALVCLYGWLDPSARRRRWVRQLVGDPLMTTTKEALQ